MEAVRPNRPNRPNRLHRASPLDPSGSSGRPIGSVESVESMYGRPPGAASPYAGLPPFRFHRPRSAASLGVSRAAPERFSCVPLDSLPHGPTALRAGRGVRVRSIAGSLFCAGFEPHVRHLLPQSARFREGFAQGSELPLDHVDDPADQHEKAVCADARIRIVEPTGKLRALGPDVDRGIAEGDRPRCAKVSIITSPVFHS